MEIDGFCTSQWLVGSLHLFNDNTRPSGHISHPTQEDVSQGCFQSLNELIQLSYIVRVWGLVQFQIWYQFGDYPCK